MIEDPFPLDEEEYIDLWRNFPNMAREEFDAFMKTYKHLSDIENLYKHENNEAP